MTYIIKIAKARNKDHGLTEREEEKEWGEES